MSPELERLLNALWELENCEPKHRARHEATVHRLVADARSRQPGISHDEFMDAVIPRYAQFRRARRKPSTLPPQA